jgi:hypothetical protein
MPRRLDVIRGSAITWGRGPDTEREEGVVHEWLVLSRSWNDRAGAEWVLTPVDSPGEPEWRFRTAGLALEYARAYDPQGRPRDGIPRLSGCEDC